jgi:hypothetical protein
MIVFINFFFKELIIAEMSEISLNKFEKEKKVIELHEEGKTIRAIAPLVHMSFGPISKIIKAYEKKVRLEQTKKDENSQSNQIKKLSKSSQAYALFLDGKTPVQVAIDLDLEFSHVRKYWTEYLRLKNMIKLYNIYIEDEFHLDNLFKINYFLLRNKIPVQDCENILRVALETAKLHQIHSNLKTEIEKLKQIKNNMHYSQYNQLAPLKPLPDINWHNQYTNNRF